MNLKNNVKCPECGKFWGYDPNCEVKEVFCSFACSTRHAEGEELSKNLNPIFAEALKVFTNGGKK